MRLNLLTTTLLMALSTTSMAATWNDNGTIETKTVLNSNYIQFDDKCYIITDNSVSSEKVEIPKGTTSKAQILFIEKEISKDSDSVNKSASTQIIMNLEKSEARITIACHSSGILFPTAGLPTVKELIEQVKEFIEVRK